MHKFVDYVIIFTIFGKKITSQGQNQIFLGVSIIEHGQLLSINKSIVYIKINTLPIRIFSNFQMLHIPTVQYVKNKNGLILMYKV